MREVLIAGVGMTKFGKYLDMSLKRLSEESVTLALKDGGIGRGEIQAAYVGNAAAGSMQGQEMILGQVILKASGIEGIPIFNFENACASSSAAFHFAWLSVSSGMHDCVLVHGIEKLSHADKSKSFNALLGALDVEEAKEKLVGLDPSRSYLMDVYAQSAKRYMDQYGATNYHLAEIGSKNHMNGAANPYAQYRRTLTIDDVLNDRLVVDPFTRAMCAPISDGSASVILCSKQFANKRGVRKPYVFVDTSVSLSTSSTNLGVISRTAQLAYKKSGMDPKEIGVYEIHDTTAAAEIIAYEELGICQEGDGFKMIVDDITTSNGRKPVNLSGGLIAKGHPVGATGLGQIIELNWQLKNESKGIQADDPKTGLAQNAGGHLGTENAVCGITIIKK